MISGLLRMEFPNDRFMGEEDAAARRHGQTPPLIGSARARPLRLLKTRLAALGPSL